MLAALLSAVAAAANLIVDKIALSRERISLKVFLPILFIFLFAITFLLTPFLGTFDFEFLRLENVLFLLFLVIVISVAHNVLFYQGIQKESVHQHELLMMTLPLVTVVMAAAFYPSELDYRVFGLSVVASVALLFAKGEKEHFFINAVSYNTFLAVVLMATESIIIRELLYFFPPVALYAIRTFMIAIFFALYYRPAYGRVKSAHWWIIFASAAIGVVQVVGRYYAYSELGIVYTTLLTVLAPVIVFLASWEILHERIRPRVLTAAVVIVVCVAIATLISFT